MAQQDRDYQPISAEALQALREYVDGALCHAVIPTSPVPPLEGLLAGFPHGSIIAARPEVDTNGPHLAVDIYDHTRQRLRTRLMGYAGLLVLRLLTVSGGHPYFDNNQKGGKEKHYLQIHGGGPRRGTQLQRVLLNAGPKEGVRFIGDHHDLRPFNLRRGGGNGKNYARADVTGEAKRLLDPRLISLTNYERLLTSAFALLDLDRLGRRLKIRASEKSAKAA